MKTEYNKEHLKIREEEAAEAAAAKKLKPVGDGEKKLRTMRDETTTKPPKEVYKVSENGKSSIRGISFVFPQQFQLESSGCLGIWQSKAFW